VNIDFHRHAVFSGYVLLLILSGLIMIGSVVRARRASRAGRLVSALLGTGFLGYGLYLAIIFGGGHYVVFYQAFGPPLPLIVLMVTRWRARPALRTLAPPVPQQQTGAKPSYPPPPAYLLPGYQPHEHSSAQPDWVTAAAPTVTAPTAADSDSRQQPEHAMTAAPTYPPPLPGRSSVWWFGHGTVIGVIGVPLVLCTPICWLFNDPYRTVWAAACTAPAVILGVFGLIMIIRGAIKAHSERMAGYTVMIAVAQQRPELVLRHPFTLEPIAGPHERLGGLRVNFTYRQFVWW
jgi:hypothetical protein